MIWHAISVVLLIINIVQSLSFNVKLSSKTAHTYRGQLLTLFTFIDGRGSTLKFHLAHELHRPGSLYLFSLGVQRPKYGVYGNECLDFYKRSLINVSLVNKSANFHLGSFTGHFPAALVYADQDTCQDSVKNGPADEAIMHVTVLNSHGEQLSGTLIGLHEHFTGLLCLYGIAVVLVLYLIRVSSCCMSQPTALFTSYPIGGNTELGNMHSTRLSGEDRSSPVCSNTFCRQCSLCCGNDGHLTRDCQRSGIGRFDGQTKRLQLLTVLLVMQLLSISFARLELSRFSNTTDVTYLNHPVAGADGPYGHMAELCSLISHHIFLALLILALVKSIRRSDVHIPRDSMSNGVDNGSTCSVPVISIFGYISFTFLHRLNSILLLTQVVWYLMREGLYWQATYAPPEVWPLEEKHAFWAGWGLPNNNYLTASSVMTSSSFQSSSVLITWLWTAWNLFTIYSPVSVILFLARSLLGLGLAAWLLRASRVERTARYRVMQSRFAMVSFTWFLSYPLVGLCAFLLAEHIRYKLTVVGITLVQTGCLGFLLAFVSRQTLFWDISSLSASLPPLKGSPTLSR